ncbi:uncharacterized protein SPAPADRAFT_59467, partial [Spathaspora passalidarum NRRL Y-27907]
MSKLVSRWADDDSLVEEAIKQDSKVNTKHTRESDWHKPITVKANEALPSRWADADDEPAPVPEPIEKSPKKYNRYEQHKQRGDFEHRGGRQGGRGDYPTPPHSRHSDEMKQGSYPSKADRYSNRRPVKREPEPEQDDEQPEEDLDDVELEKGPMTDAAKAFAARLGISAGGFDKGSTKKNSKEQESDEWEDADEEEKEEDEKKKKSQVKERQSANPLASRLGKLSINENKKKPNQRKDI